MSFLLLPFQRITRIKMLVEVSSSEVPAFQGGGVLRRSESDERAQAFLISNTRTVCIHVETTHPCEASCCFPSQNILKRTKEGTKEEQTASKALASVSKVKASGKSHVSCCLTGFRLIENLTNEVFRSV